MTIFRGPGGGGNATTDSELNALTAISLEALASALVASDAATAAAASAGAALASELAAEDAELGAEVSVVSTLGSANDAALSEFNAAASALAAQTSGSAIALAASLAGSGGSALVGYLPAGTGAVARTVQNKQRESVSVKDFGAVGNGVVDDTSAINAAWAYCDDSGISLFLPAGVYRVTATLTGKPILISGESGTRIVFDNFAGKNGITFQPATQVGAAGGLVGLELVAKSANGLTCVEMPKQADQYSTYYTRWVFKDLYCRGENRNLAAYSFCWDYGFAKWFRLSDCTGLSFENVTVQGQFDIILNPAGQFADCAVEMDAAAALLTARMKDVNFGTLHTAVLWGDRSFFSLANFDIIGTFRGIYQVATVVFNEPKIQHGNINAQDSGIYFNGAETIVIDDVTIRRHPSGWKGGSAVWYGIRALNASDLKIVQTSVQPDESAGAFTGVMTAMFLQTCSLASLSGNFVGPGNDVGIALDNCTGMALNSTISGQNAAADVLFNLINNTRITTIGAYELVSSFAGTVLQKDVTIVGAIQMLNKTPDLQGTGNINRDTTRVNGALDSKKWREITSATAQQRQVLTDVGAATNYELVTRSGVTVTQIEWRASAFKFNNGPTLTTSGATPEGSVTAPIGSIHFRTDSLVSPKFYVKETGTGNTGWIGK